MTGDPATGRQLRDARILLGLGLREAADRLGPNPDGLARAETMYGIPPWPVADASRVRAALEAAGVEFLALEPAG